MIKSRKISIHHFIATMYTIHKPTSMHCGPIFVNLVHLSNILGDRQWSISFFILKIAILISNLEG